MNSTTLWYAAASSGLMALILLTLTMVLGITTTTTPARNWPGPAPVQLHRRISILAVVFLGIHMLHTSVLDTFVNISWAAIVIRSRRRCFELLGRRGRRGARPDGGRVRHQPAARPDAAPAPGAPCTGWRT